MKKATLSSKYQITIPSQMRNKLGLKDKDKSKCIVCKGKGQLEGINEKEKECFLCRGESQIENEMLEDAHKVIQVIMQQGRRYGVGVTLLADPTPYIVNDEEMPYIPIFELKSSEYTKETLERVEDEIRKLLIIKETPRSASNSELFACPSDLILDKILSTLNTKEAKEEVRKWFRYERTEFKGSNKRK